MIQLVEMQPEMESTSELPDIPITIFEKCGQQWEFGISGELESFLDDIAARSPLTESFVFADSKILRQNSSFTKSIQEKLQECYGMPSDIWSAVHWESNEYFGCSNGVAGENTCHNTWSRFSFTTIFETEKGRFPDVYNYAWGTAGFFTTWKVTGPKSAFKLVAQYYSNVVVAHGRAAIADAAAMRIIAGLTVIFLPATFVSAVFSISFFNNDSGVWTMSHEFWIFWAVSIPLTMFTIVLLLLGGCLRRSRTAKDHPNQLICQYIAIFLDKIQNRIYIFRAVRPLGRDHLMLIDIYFTLSLL